MAARPRVGFVTLPDTLEEFTRGSPVGAMEVVRFESARIRPVARTAWLPRILRAPQFDTIVVTSRRAIPHGLLPWARASRSTTGPSELWAVGPATARAVSAALGRRCRHPSPAGGAELERALRRSPGRRILYFRSDRAGPELARGLRKHGHRVREAVVYRTHSPAPLSLRRRAVLSTLRLLVASSPSALVFLRRSAGRATWTALRRTVPVIVPGPRSARCARHLGFADVRIVRWDRPQRFTRRLLEEVRHAPSRA